MIEWLSKLVFAAEQESDKNVVRGSHLMNGALKWAAFEAARGARERPPGSNSGPDVLTYTCGKVGPWCAAFLCWCFERAAAEIDASVPFARTHSARTLYHRIAKAGEVSEHPKAGDVAFWDRGAKGSWKGHVGIVSKVWPDGTFETIEGNRGRTGRVRTFIHEVGEGRLRGFARLH